MELFNKTLLTIFMVIIASGKANPDDPHVKQTTELSSLKSSQQLSTGVEPLVGSTHNTENVHSREKRQFGFGYGNPYYGRRYRPYPLPVFGGGFGGYGYGRGFGGRGFGGRGFGGRGGGFGGRGGGFGGRGGGIGGRGGGGGHGGGRG